MFLYAAISGGIILDKNNITLWTEFEDILSKFSDEQEEQEIISPTPRGVKFKNQVELTGDLPVYPTNVVKRVPHYHYGSGCDCKVENNMIDLGRSHFPRYLMNAVCEDNRESSNGKCSHGFKCKPIEYNVSVLAVKTRRKLIDNNQLTPKVPPMLRSHFTFKAVTAIAGCICSQL